MSGEAWAFIFMFLILKIPVCAALYLVWWSARDPAQTDESLGDSGGGRGPDHPRRPRPRPPRRGPHADRPPASPSRVRVHRPRTTHQHR